MNHHCCQKTRVHTYNTLVVVIYPSIQKSVSMSCGVEKGAKQTRARARPLFRCGSIPNPQSSLWWYHSNHTATIPYHTSSFSTMSPIKRALYDKSQEQGLAPKRLRGGGAEEDDDDDQEQLYRDLMQNDDDEEEEEEAMPPPPPAMDNDDDDTPAVPILSNRWQRPALRSDLSQADEINLQWLDMDVVSGQPAAPGLNSLAPTKQRGTSEGSVPILRTFGVTDEGNSIAVFLHGFTPYGYFAVPPDVTVDRSQMDAMRHVLQTQLMAAARGKPDVRVLGVEHLTDHGSLMGYDAPVKEFLKVYVNLPNHIPTLRRVMEQGVELPGLLRDGQQAAGWTELQPFENNVPFVLRFMVDQKLVGAGWLTLPAQTYKIREHKETHCQVSG